MTRARKAQEEMVGFVLIVIMLVVISIVFLFLMKPAKIEARENSQTINLMASILESTEGGMKVSEIVRDCSHGVGCNRAREVLEQRLSAAMKYETTIVGQRLNGYSLNVSKGSMPLIPSIESGELSGNMATGPWPIEDVTVILKIYY